MNNTYDTDPAPDSSPTRPETPSAMKAVSPWEELCALSVYLDKECLNFVLSLAEDRLSEEEINWLLNNARDNFELSNKFKKDF